VETTKTAAVKTSGEGGIWLAERGNAQESSCGCQNPCPPASGSRFV
jgi:hypothetical protein